MAEFHSFSGFDGLAEFAAAEVAALLRQDIAERGAASLAVSGGRTPAPFFSALAGHDLGWPRVAITLADERWVDETSPQSNAALVKQTLLTGSAAAAKFVPLYTGAESPEAGLATAEARIAALPRPWSAVMLGMGDDGHFASLFPGETALAVGLDLNSTARCVAAIGPSGGPPRLSLTLSCLAQARHIYVLATGEHKRKIWEDAAKADPQILPAAALHDPSLPKVDFLWCP